MTKLRAAGSGAVAGVVSAFAFAVIHDLFISDIWFSLIPMMIAGGICGVCIAWTYSLLVQRPSLASWLRYNGIYLAMFGALGIASVLVFEPVTTLASVIAANAPPNDLILQAMPMTVAFLVLMAALIGWRYARRWQDYGAIAVTCVMLVTLVGLNISAIGLVDVPSSAAYLIVELFGLTAFLNLVYVVVFVGLERRHLGVAPSTRDAA